MSNENPNFMIRPCYVPEIGFFLHALKKRLETYFETVTVQYVKCPDLTQPPYRLVAPGLCGNTGQLITGNFASVYPLPKTDRIYNFKKLLKEINRVTVNTLLLGSGLCFSSDIGPEKVMCTVSMNALFSPTNVNKEIEINVTNESRGAFVVIEKDNSSFLHKNRNESDITRYEQASFSSHLELSSIYALDPLREKMDRKYSSCILKNPNPECIMSGNFFISEGQRGQVLRVHVKKRISQIGFLEALQISLVEIKGPVTNPLGLGGTFVMSGGNVATYVMPSTFPPNPLDDRSAIFNHLYQKVVPAKSLVAVGAVCTEHETWFNFSTFNQHEACGMFNDGLSENVTEYEGYFSLMENIYEFSHDSVITIKDFYEFDWIFGMDEYIIHKLYRIQPADSPALIELLGKYDPAEIVNIEDPIFDDSIIGFETAFQIILRSVCTFLEINKDNIQ